MFKVYVIALMLISSVVAADQWSFPPELKTEEFSFGDLVIEKSIDTRKNQHYPLYSVKAYRRGEELANYRNLTFEFIQSFDDGNLIFAGTNSGLSRFSYFILDRNGGLIKATLHGEDIPYCERSVSIVREWLPEKIEIKEQYQEYKYDDESIPERYFSGATIKVCDGSYLKIL